MSTPAARRLGGTLTRRLLFVALTGALVSAGVGMGSAQASKGSPAASGKVTPGTASAGDSAGPDTQGVNGAAPTRFATFTLNGGYVASGTSLRNRGYGTVYASGIPTGATVRAAYLIWTVLGNGEGGSFNDGIFRGHSIVGTRVGSGSSPCWPEASQGFTYRSNVTSWVTGNGAYSLRNFASGRTDAADPWTSTAVRPLAEGASLVVVYSKARYPMTRVVLHNGYGMTSSAANALTLNASWGFAASNPVGDVRTTFIGGDGQDAPEPASTFNGVPLWQPDWDGTDRPLPRFSHGNLWDTDTARVGRLVAPGQTSATIRVTGGSDCLAWAGQATSIAVNGAADTDGDKLLDGWEVNGYDANGDGIVDVNLPAFGANVVRKDLFVEMDYMGAEATCPCHLPLAADLRRIVAVYANAPYAYNPNGQRGIRLHLDAGAARGAEFNLGGGNLVAHDDDLNPVVPQFTAIKNANFNPLRAKIFYYMIWAHNYDGGSSSGNAFAIPNDSFVVTLGSWPSHGTSDVKVGTFVHEFGHDLGQLHGGNDNGNYKPNYLSVMNYAFQVTGVPRTGSLPADFGYSWSTLPSRNENALNENIGLNSTTASTYKTRWFCPSGAQVQSPGTANGPLDWDCSGVATGIRAADINGDGFRSTLGTYNNWAHLVYGGGAVGGGVSATTRLMNQPSLQESIPSELTLKEARQRQLVR